MELNVIGAQPNSVLLKLNGNLRELLSCSDGFQ